MACYTHLIDENDLPFRTHSVTIWKGTHLYLFLSLFASFCLCASFLLLSFAISLFLSLALPLSLPLHLFTSLPFFLSPLFSPNQMIEEKTGAHTALCCLNSDQVITWSRLGSGARDEGTRRRASDDMHLLKRTWIEKKNISNSKLCPFIDLK